MSEREEKRGEDYRGKKTVELCSNSSGAFAIGGLFWFLFALVEGGGGEEFLCQFCESEAQPSSLRLSLVAVAIACIEEGAQLHRCVAWLAV